MCHYFKYLRAISPFFFSLSLSFLIKKNLFAQASGSPWLVFICSDGTVFRLSYKASGMLSLHCFLLCEFQPQKGFLQMVAKTVPGYAYQLHSCLCMLGLSVVEEEIRELSQSL